jgi:succinoglycan biosynthesis transport protein ExoP
MLAVGGGFVRMTLGSLLALFLEHRDKTFRTSAQIQQQVNLQTIGATPRAARRRRKSPADMLLDDSRSAVAEAFRLCWANVQLAIEEPNTGSAFGRRGTGMVLGITSAATGEGKSTHALAFARTAALAGDRVVLVDADLRRSGVSRLVGGDPRFTLSDFLRGRCHSGGQVRSLLDKRVGALVTVGLAAGALRSAKSFTSVAGGLVIDVINRSADSSR